MHTCTRCKKQVNDDCPQYLIQKENHEQVELIRASKGLEYPGQAFDYLCPMCSIPRARIVVFKAMDYYGVAQSPTCSSCPQYTLCLTLGI